MTALIFTLNLSKTRNTYIQVCVVLDIVGVQVRGVSKTSCNLQSAESVDLCHAVGRLTDIFEYI